MTFVNIKVEKGLDPSSDIVKNKNKTKSETPSHYSADRMKYAELQSSTNN
jgi:hypothetical protein